MTFSETTAIGLRFLRYLLFNLRRKQFKVVAPQKIITFTFA